MLGSSPDQSDLGSPPVQGENSFSPTWVMPPMMGVGGIQVVATVVAPVGGGGAPGGVELMLEESLSVLLLSISEGSLDQSARVCSEMSERGDPIALNGVGRVGVSEEMFARQNSDEMGWDGSNYVLGVRGVNGSRMGCDNRNRPWLLWEQLVEQIDQIGW